MARQKQGTANKNKLKAASTNAAHKAVRIDKWLWAARFYKTRSLASDAVKTGKVLLNESRAKPSKDIETDDKITIKQGFTEKTVVVLTLSESRGPATVAATLYEETKHSIAKHEQLLAMKKAQPALRDNGLGRPTKRERRQIIQFTQKDSS